VSTSRSAGGTRSRALILESDPVLQQLFIRIAAAEGCEPLLARSELEGYSLLAEHVETISLVLVNVTGDGIDAVVFRQWQLDAPRVSRIQTVMFSSRALCASEMAALQPATPVIRLLPGCATLRLTTDSTQAGFAA
jgi:hypothetical protein